MRVRIARPDYDHLMCFTLASALPGMSVDPQDGSITCEVPEELLGTCRRADPSFAQSLVNRRLPDPPIAPI